MSHWNHRVLRFNNTKDEIEVGNGEYIYAFAECYYDDAGNMDGYCVRRPITEDPHWLLEMYKKALIKGIVIKDEYLEGDFNENLSDAPLPWNP